MEEGYLMKAGGGCDPRRRGLCFSAPEKPAVTRAEMRYKAKQMIQSMERRG